MLKGGTFGCPLVAVPYSFPTFQGLTLKSNNDGAA
jgi:hypothetical protein